MKEKKAKKPSFWRQLSNEFRRSKSTFILFIVLRTLVILVGIRQLFIGNYENVFLCVLTLALFLVPAFIEKTFRVVVPSLLEKVVLIFIFAAEIMGEIGDYYVNYPLWDTMLHTTTGFLAAAVGLSLIDILNRSERFKFYLSPLFVALVSFCFSMTIGVLWEFLEFGADMLLQTDMQKDTVVTSISSVLLNPAMTNTAVKITGITETAVNGEVLGISGYLDIGLFDTMKDMFVNFIGAVVFSVFGFFYAKYTGTNKSAPIVDGLRLRRREEEDETKG
ncbi:MAG: hypothetical protein E7632_02900 [Ruminococcaceae bacterium]|nr:hypothetical protein [Oscillospiraceae bacterium]